MGRAIPAHPQPHEHRTLPGARAVGRGELLPQSGRGAGAVVLHDGPGPPLGGLPSREVLGWVRGDACVVVCMVVYCVWRVVWCDVYGVYMYSAVCIAYNLSDPVPTPIPYKILNCI